MINNFLRTNVYASIILLLVRLYLGYEWITAGFGKITGGFSAEGFLKGAIQKPVTSHNEIIYPTYTAFINNIALPHVDIINFVIPYGEFLVGLGLILGVLTTYATFFGVVMNLAFLFAGTISSSPFMVMLSIFLLIAGNNAGRFGGDRWVIPYLNRLVCKKK